MMSIRLVYFNGFGEDFRVDQLIRQGDDLPIDLRGERSFIQRIEMVYRSRPNFRGQAVIKVYGEPARFGGRAAARQTRTGRAPVQAVTGKSWAASGSPCSARIATASASAGARAASRRFACTCVAQTSRCSISRSYMETASPTTFACAISFGRRSHPAAGPEGMGALYRPRRHDVSHRRKSVDIIAKQRISTARSASRDCSSLIASRVNSSRGPPFGGPLCICALD